MRLAITGVAQRNASLGASREAIPNINVSFIRAGAREASALRSLILTRTAQHTTLIVTCQLHLQRWGASPEAISSKHRTSSAHGAPEGATRTAWDGEQASFFDPRLAASGTGIDLQATAFASYVAAGRLESPLHRTPRSSGP